MSVYDQLVPALTYPQVTRLSPNKTATSVSELKNQIAALMPGDWLRVKAGTYAGEIGIKRTLPGYAKITLDAGCKFVGVNTNTNLPALWIQPGCSYLQLINQGATIVNPGGGAGILQYGSHHMVFDGFDISDTGSQGFAALPIGGDIHDCFYRGQAYNIGINHNRDPHVDKGSGLHTMLVGDSGAGSFRNNVVAIYGHDCTYSGGAVLELGDGSSSYPTRYNKLYVKGHNMLFVAKTQIGGNGVNAWGHQHDNTFVVVEVDNMMEYAVATDLYGPAPNSVVLQGSAVKCCQNPKVKGQNPWKPGSGFTYKNVTTT